MKNKVRNVKCEVRTEQIGRHFLLLTWAFSLLTLSVCFLQLSTFNLQP